MSDLVRFCLLAVLAIGTSLETGINTLGIVAFVVMNLLSHMNDQLDLLLMAVLPEEVTAPDPDTDHDRANP